MSVVVAAGLLWFASVQEEKCKSKSGEEGRREVEEEVQVQVQEEEEEEEKWKEPRRDGGDEKLLLERSTE